MQQAAGDKPQTNGRGYAIVYIFLAVLNIHIRIPLGGLLPFFMAVYPFRITDVYYKDYSKPLAVEYNKSFAYTKIVLKAQRLSG